MSRGPHQIRPTRPTVATIALGGAKHPRWNEGRQRACMASLESFPWKPGERVDGPPRRRPGHFIAGLPA
jgi:hypothetical protein